MPEPITIEGLNAIPAETFRTLLPADIQGKPYAKEITGFSDLLKRFDGAQTLLGQRALPDANTPPEKWEEFHSKLRPESADKYELPTHIEGIPDEYVASLANSKILKTLAFESGLSPYQAKIQLTGLVKHLFTAEQQEKAAAAEASKAKDAEFAALSESLFKGKKDEVLTNAKKFLAGHMPDDAKKLLEGMDERQLTVLIAATDSLVQKFTGEDPYRGGSGSGASGGAITEASVVGEMQEIMKDPAYQDPFKDKLKHQQLLDKMEACRVKLRSLKK